jgi:hypothetical protein
MLSSGIFLHLFFIILIQIEIGGLLAAPIEIRRGSRQVSLDDLIHTALKIVQPIFDTSQPLLENSQMIPKRVDKFLNNHRVAQEFRRF